MTYKELLDSVSFEEIVPFIEKYEQELRMNIAFYEYEEKKTEQYRKLESQKGTLGRVPVSP